MLKNWLMYIYRYFGNHGIFLLSRVPVIIKSFVMANFFECSGKCLHPVKWNSGKFDLQIDSHQKLCKKQSGLSALGL